MRFWEISFVAINFGLLGWILFGNGKTGRRPMLPLAIAYGLLIVQLIVDGARWQMIPAYLAPLVLTLCLMFRKRQKSGRSRIVITLQAALLVLFLTVAVAMPALMPVFSFDKPTGPYAVGTTQYDWVDVRRGKIIRTIPATTVSLWCKSGIRQNKTARSSRLHTSLT